jgi:hypothetical protein
MLILLINTMDKSLPAEANLNLISILMDKELNTMSTQLDLLLMQMETLFVLQEELNASLNIYKIFIASQQILRLSQKNQ